MTDRIPKTMQAAVYRGIGHLQIETVPVPRIGSNEVLVKVAACGVCPTDIKKIQFGTVPPPRIFGHETSGIIVKSGARVRPWRVGDRVALHHHVPCLDCHACRHRTFAQCEQYKRTGITAGFEPSGGGFAEYVRVLAFALPGIVQIPARNSFIEGAMLEPVNTVLKAVKRLELLAGDLVMVMGQGPIGLMFTRLLALQQARVLATDLIPSRLELARQLGARWACNVRRTDVVRHAQAISRGRGLDAVVVAVPSDGAVRQALESVRGGGKVLLFAHTRRGCELPLDLAAVCVDEKDVIGSYSADWTLQQEVATLVFARKLDVRKLVSHSFSLSEAEAAIQLASQPSSGSLKIVVSQRL